MPTKIYLNEYIFTFGFNQARSIMHWLYDTKWGFQYDSREGAGVTRFELKEVEGQLP